MYHRFYKINYEVPVFVKSPSPNSSESQSELQFNTNYNEYPTKQGIKSNTSNITFAVPDSPTSPTCCCQSPQSPDGCPASQPGNLQFPSPQSCSYIPEEWKGYQNYINQVYDAQMYNAYNATYNCPTVNPPMPCFCKCVLCQQAHPSPTPKECPSTPAAPQEPVNVCPATVQDSKCPAFKKERRLSHEFLWPENLAYQKYLRPGICTMPPKCRCRKRNQSSNTTLKGRKSNQNQTSSCRFEPSTGVCSNSTTKTGGCCGRRPSNSKSKKKINTVNLVKYECYAQATHEVCSNRASAPKCPPKCPSLQNMAASKKPPCQSESKIQMICVPSKTSNASKRSKKKDKGSRKSSVSGNKSIPCVCPEECWKEYIRQTYTFAIQQNPPCMPKDMFMHHTEEKHTAKVKTSPHKSHEDSKVSFAVTCETKKECGTNVALCETEQEPSPKPTPCSTPEPPSSCTDNSQNTQPVSCPGKEEVETQCGCFYRNDLGNKILLLQSGNHPVSIVKCTVGGPSAKPDNVKISENCTCLYY